MMARTRALRLSALALVVALSLGTVSVARAQTAAQPLENTTIQVQVWPETEGNTLVIVGATLPTDTPLPVTIELPLPLGAQVQWVGEIEGTDPDLDVELDYEVVPATGGSAVRFTVDKYLMFQYEAFLPATLVDGNKRSATLDWIQTVPSLDLSVAWKLPMGAQTPVFDPDAPGTPAMNSAGESLYTLVSMTPQVGESLSFQAVYSYADTAEGTDSGVGIIPIILGLLAIAVVALVIVVSRQRSAVQEDA